MVRNFLVTALLAVLCLTNTSAITPIPVDVCYWKDQTCHTDYLNLGFSQNNFTLHDEQTPSAASTQEDGISRKYRPGGSGPAGVDSPLRKKRRNRGGVLSLATVYRDVNVHRSPYYWDYDSLVVNHTDLSRYGFGKKIGRGTFSNVFKGIDAQTNKQIIIKRLKSKMDQRKIQREILVLQALQGGPNIIDLLDVSRNMDTGKTSFIFEYVNNPDWRELFPTFSMDEIRVYIFEVLKALEYAHSNGIMHRDIKPHNIVYDFPRRKLRVIDWGLAEFYHPNKEYNVRVASRHFKGPELLVGLRDYDYSLDIWSLGCVLAGMIFKVDKFFEGSDNEDQLVKIAYVLGTKDLESYVSKYGLTLDATQRMNIGSRSRKPWAKFKNEENAHLFQPDVIDLLDRMLVYDHQKRISAKDAMAHPFFDPIRDNVSMDKSSGVEENKEDDVEDIVINL